MTSLRAFAAGAGGVLLAGLIVLLLAGSSDRRSTAFSLDVPAAGPAAVLNAGASACQKSVGLRRRADAVTLWTLPAPAPGQASVRVIDPSGAGLSAPLTQVGAEDEQHGYRAARAALPRGVGPGQATVCVSWRGPCQLAVGGSSPTQWAMIFDAPHPGSLLSTLPAALRRAALFHPGWVGPWTFWVLLGGLPAALLLVLVATARGLTGPRRPSGSDR